MAAAAVIAAVRPDILLLTDFDWDAAGAALGAFRDVLDAEGMDFPFAYSPRPNRGLPSGFDLDGDGTDSGPGDALGWGRFTGEGGMVLLSRFPLAVETAQDFSSFLWRDLPGTRIADADLPSGPEAVLPLSSTAHWDVPVILPHGTVLHVLAFAAGPPVFRPEQLNRSRNHDETAFWLRYLDGAIGVPPPVASVVIVGNANADPSDGAGDLSAIRSLLSDPRLSDPRPASAGGGASAMHGGTGRPDLDTAEWSSNPNVGTNLRVDYILPSRDLAITASGVWWPAPGTADAKVAQTASAHRLVWLDFVP
jgi:Endonuclease/Exonuclease/phosphatase family